MIIIDFFVERLDSIAGIGPKALAALTQYFSDPVSRRIFTELLQQVVVESSRTFQPRVLAVGETALDQTQTGGADNGLVQPARPLEGKRVVVTGTFKTLTRVEVEERIVALGGIIAKTISKKVDLLLVASMAASEGAKAKKAQVLGIPTMTEEEFLDLLYTFSQPVER